jgi:hypothetical protein
MSSTFLGHNWDTIQNRWGYTVIAIIFFGTQLGHICCEFIKPENLLLNEKIPLTSTNDQNVVSEGLSFRFSPQGGFGRILEVAE